MPGGAAETNQMNDPYRCATVRNTWSSGASTTWRTDRPGALRRLVSALFAVFGVVPLDPQVRKR
jgi:hypothetical protein